MAEPIVTRFGWSNKERAMGKPGINLSDATMTAWREVVEELQRTPPPLFGEEIEFGDANDFEHKLIHFFHTLKDADGMHNLSQTKMHELLVALELDEDLAAQASERWQVDQVRGLHSEVDQIISRGRIQNKLGNEIGANHTYSKALHILDHAAVLKPNLDSLFTRAILHSRLHSLDKALELICKAIDDEPNNSTLYLWRAALYKKLGDKTNEGRDRRKAQKLNRALD